MAVVDAAEANRSFPPLLRQVAAGGLAMPGGRFPAPQLSGTTIDSYGCGDSFAACATHLGPYPG